MCENVITNIPKWLHDYASVYTVALCHVIRSLSTVGCDQQLWPKAINITTEFSKKLICLCVDYYGSHGS